MTKDEVILASLATSDYVIYGPVQVQKLVFLVDDRISPSLGADRFDFIPYHYGPFDAVVYEILDKLADDGEVEIVEDRRVPHSQYRLTRSGQRRGSSLLEAFGEDDTSRIQELSSFVRRVTFAQLVSAIYNAYPAMRENSVFGGSAINKKH